MNNTPPPEKADKRLEDFTPVAHPQVVPPPPRPNQEAGDADQFPSVPGEFYVSVGLQNAALEFSESSVPGSRSFIDNRSTERWQNTEAGTSHGANANDVINASEAGPFNIADSEQPAANGINEEPAPSSSKRCLPLFRSSSPPPKRRWNSDPTPPLDPPDLEQEVVVAAAQPQLPFEKEPAEPAQPQQQPLEQQLLFEQEYPEPVNQQNINAQNGNGEVASNYLFLSTTHYSSNRLLHFHFLDDRHFSGRIDITGFQNVPIIVWTSEVHMEFVSEGSMNSANDELYHCTSGVITFPAVINLQNFICWIDGNYLYFQAMIL
uniref:Uncharacterized protein n=1 Tax=Panagrolaimus davidi TaxID=227884 RepID=A0A914P7M9_9BILA